MILGKTIETGQEGIWQAGIAARSAIRDIEALHESTPPTVLLIGWLLPMTAAIGGVLANAVAVGIVVSFVATFAARFGPFELAGQDNADVILQRAAILKTRTNNLSIGALLAELAANAAEIAAL